MKMVKSLLLGSAAGLAAIAGAQAADLPVKAKPVQYVKICSLYGVGFYYIPGTDMCLKIGGWMRAEWAETPNGNFTWGPFNGVANTRATNNWAGRARGYITADSRNQTAYGTVRSYIAVGINTNDVGTNTAANQFSANRGFIQWAGFTFGLAQSFYDFYSVPATAYWGNYPASDTGDPGWLVAAYTAQFGNGLSGSISAETRRMTQIIGTSSTTGLVLAAPAGGLVVPGTYANGTGVGTNSVAGAVFPGVGAYGGQQVPDVVGNLRLDQAWGSAQVMAAYHDVNAVYYDSTSTGGTNPVQAHPSDKAGFVVGGGIKINAPAIGKGDYLQAQVNYTQGALKYIFQTPNSNWGARKGDTLGFGVLSDAVYGGSPGTNANATSAELTTGWGVNAAYEHFWNSQWRTSLYGGYAEVDYDRLANAMLCRAEGGTNGVGAAAAGTVGSNAIAAGGCNNNWSTWWLGSRTQWNVTSDFYMGVDVIYQKLQSATLVNNLATTVVNSGTLAGTTFIGDQDAWSFRFRVHKDFYP